MPRIIKRTAKFAIVLSAMTIACAIVWQILGDKLYDCTDSVPIPGYLTPGDWVHEVNDYPVMPVPHVAHGRSMSEPDTIKEGWTVFDLWCLWFSFVGVSLGISFFAACIPWSTYPTRQP
jgi:hypothetical protein